MSEPENEQRTLTDDQIRVSASVRSANEVLQAAMPYFAAARQAAPGTPGAERPIEVPPAVFRDLVVMLAAELKRAGQLAARPNGDPGDGDWNPFNGIDFEFD